MNAILEWVKSGLIFAIFASVILMLSPNKTYMKHISLVVGLLFILVMVHPVMEVFGLDGKAYVTYIEQFLMLEESETGISDEHMDLYLQSVELQVLAALKENGYGVGEVHMVADTEGNVEEVHISFTAEVAGLEMIEEYLKNLFGQEVKIYYEVS